MRVSHLPAIYPEARKMVLFGLKSLGKPISARLVTWGRSFICGYRKMQFSTSETLLSLQWPVWLSSHKSHFPQLKSLCSELQPGLACGSRAVIPKCGPQSSSTREPVSKINSQDLPQIHWLRTAGSHMPPGECDVSSDLRSSSRTNPSLTYQDDTAPRGFLLQP